VTLFVVHSTDYSYLAGAVAVFSTRERAVLYIDGREGLEIEEHELDPNAAILDAGFKLFEVILHRNGKLHRLERVYDEPLNAGALVDGWSRRADGTWTVWHFRCVVQATDERDALREGQVARMAWLLKPTNVWPDAVPPPPPLPAWKPLRTEDLDDIETAVWFGNAGEDLPANAHNHD
jgi:hypothetical protein